jgi:hypothetical protein
MGDSDNKSKRIKIALGHFIIKQNVMEAKFELKYIFANINEWLKFAEAKHLWTKKLEPITAATRNWRFSG